MENTTKKGRFVSLSSNENGYLLAEAIIVMFIFMLLLGMLMVSFKNTNPSKYYLTTSQGYQNKEYIKLYKQIAPIIAQSLDIDGTTMIKIKSPNYLPSNRVKYINLFEHYLITDEERAREGLTTPLIVYNTLTNMATLTITRTDINSYTCEGILFYYKYDDFKQLRISLDTPLTTPSVVTITGDNFAKRAIGTEHEYKFQFSGEIIPTKLE